MENQFNLTKEQYLTVLATWRAKKEHDASDIILYNILRTKPADRGFIAKSKKIQGDDPWFAYNNALYNAHQRLNVKNMYAGQAEKWVLVGEERIKNRRDAFKQTFGIDMPEGLQAKTDGAGK
jgi:hypothetical protein